MLEKYLCALLDYTISYQWGLWYHKYRRHSRQWPWIVPSNYCITKCFGIS